MNSFNEFHKGTCILLDLLFLKHTKKKKMKKKKSLISIGLPFNCPPFQADNLSPLAQLRAADPTQNLFPTG